MATKKADKVREWAMKVQVLEGRHVQLHVLIRILELYKGYFKLHLPRKADGTYAGYDDPITHCLNTLETTSVQLRADLQDLRAEKP